MTLGVAATGSKAVEGMVKPLVRVLAPLPKVALYPAMILILGFDDASKIALVAADAVFPILLATYQGTAAVDTKLVWSARAAGSSRARALFKIVLMAALPSVLTGCRIGLIISCIVVFLAEMITSTDGLGYLLVRAGRNFQTVDMFVPLISISILGLTLNAAFNALRRGCCADLPRNADVRRPHRGQVDRRLLRGVRALRGQAGRHGGDPVGDAIARAQRASGRAGAAAARRAAVPLVVPTPRNRHPVPVRSTGASEAIGKLAPVVAHWAQAGFVVDCTIEGLMHAPETPAILKAGARIQVISNEHPEALERMAPDSALEKRVRAAAKMLRAPSA